MRACTHRLHTQTHTHARARIAALTYVLAKAAFARGGYEDANINDRSPMN